MNVWAYRLTLVVVMGVALYFVPLMHVTAIDVSMAKDGFDSAKYAESFWKERLIPATTDAHSAAQVIAALQKNVAAADKDYGVRVGVGRNFFLFVQGAGVVREMKEAGVVVALDGGEESCEVRLYDRKAFGATIRDATGLLKGNEAPSSREYNLLAGELNRLAEEQAIAKLKSLSPGNHLRFAGCAKVASPSSYQPPLEVIPVLVEVVE